MPAPGSFGYWQDPTHTHTWNEVTPRYFDPDFDQYRHYRPKPWKIERTQWYEKPLPKGVQHAMPNAGIAFLLRKRAV